VALNLVCFLDIKSGNKISEIDVRSMNTPMMIPVGVASGVLNTIGKPNATVG
jgi:hypothetical protein